MTSATKDEYRLAETDEWRITSAIDRAIHEWGPCKDRPYQLKSSDYPTLERIAAASIGCSTTDLRDSELAWINRRIADYDLD